MKDSSGLTRRAARQPGTRSVNHPAERRQPQPDRHPSTSSAESPRAAPAAAPPTPPWLWPRCKRRATMRRRGRGTTRGIATCRSSTPPLDRCPTPPRRRPVVYCSRRPAPRSPAGAARRRPPAARPAGRPPPAPAARAPNSSPSPARRRALKESRRPRRPGPGTGPRRPAVQCLLHDRCHAGAAGAWFTDRVTLWRSSEERTPGERSPDSPARVGHPAASRNRYRTVRELYANRERTVSRPQEGRRAGAAEPGRAGRDLAPVGGRWASTRGPARPDRRRPRPVGPSTVEAAGA